MLDSFINLSTKKTFNQSLAHLRAVNELADYVSEKGNLADRINEMIESGELQPIQIMPIVNVLLVEKFGYRFASLRIREDLLLEKLEKLCGLVSSWNVMEIVFVYFDPVQGTAIVNPKQKSHWQQIRELNKKENLILYLQALDKNCVHLELQALEDLKNLLNGIGKSESPQENRFADYWKELPKHSPRKNSPSIKENVSRLTRRTRIEKTADVPRQNTVTQTHRKKITPKYSCQVTNELFHNGNVEAWKNIINSYESFHPHLKVCVYHNSEKINNLNSLFKWGKVRNGDVILFNVVGENFKDIAKLQKYLFEGASNRFEIFLKKEPGVPLNLF